MQQDKCKFFMKIFSLQKILGMIGKMAEQVMGSFSGNIKNISRKFWGN